MWKKIAIGCAGITILLLIMLGVAGYKLWNMYKHSSTAGFTRPSSLSAPGVTTGANVVSKPVVISVPGVGSISDIAFDNKGNIVLAGTTGAAIGKPTLQSFISTAQWPQSMDSISIITNRIGNINYLKHGSWGSHSTLMDAQGKPVWTYKAALGIDDTAFGDVNGDGFLEFAVGLNGRGGIFLLDQSGKELWGQSDANVWHVEITDTNGDGKLEIVHSNASGQIVVRDGMGSILKSNQASGYINKFSLCAWPNRTAQRYILSSQENAVLLFDYDGKTLASLNAQGSSEYGDAKGTWVKFRNGHSDYFAVLDFVQIWDSSMLFIYSPPGKLVYREVLPGYFSSIATLIDPKTKDESLLIGGLDKVLKYSVPAGQQ